VLGLDGSGKVDIVAGGYEDWEKRRSAPRPPARAGTQTREASGEQKRGAPSTGRKLSYKDQRDLDRLPGEVERLEAEMAKAEDALHDPDLYTRDPERFAALTARLHQLRAEKDAAEHRWLEVVDLAEALARA
jgi:ATP-binding cassette subfamily F protein uup